MTPPPAAVLLLVVTPVTVTVPPSLAMPSPRIPALPLFRVSVPLLRMPPPLAGKFAVLPLIVTLVRVSSPWLRIPPPPFAGLSTVLPLTVTSLRIRLPWFRIPPPPLLRIAVLPFWMVTPEISTDLPEAMLRTREVATLGVAAAWIIVVADPSPVIVSRLSSIMSSLLRVYVPGATSILDSRVAAAKASLREQWVASHVPSSTSSKLVTL